MDLKSLDEKVVMLAELTHNAASANVMANLISSRKASIQSERKVRSSPRKQTKVAV
jgi:hypothetical protein